MSGSLDQAEIEEQMGLNSFNNHLFNNQNFKLSLSYQVIAYSIHQYKDFSSIFRAIIASNGIK